ncbi:hypothetical protein LXL04_019085 [Taraxacum kok-saghyz]
MDLAIKKKFGFAYIDDKDGRYTVNALRKKIDSKIAPVTGPKTCWSNTIPLKVRCFVWRASMNKIPVISELAKRGIMVQSNKRHLCNVESETVDHLFTSCSFTKETMAWIFKWCGINIMHFDNISGFFDFAASWGNCPRKREILNTIMHCLIWCIWLEQNDKAFNNSKDSTPKVADKIITTSHTWYNYRSRNGGGNWVEWNCSPFIHTLLS